MNKFVVASLYVIGVLSIIGGIGIGFATYEVTVPGYDYLTEKSWSVFFMWFFAGLISGVMMFGFAEIVKHLSRQTEYQRKMFVKMDGQSDYILKRTE